ncbi:type II toxin-antitoxin system HipA family toxin [bacterium M00.F.Ca.ET.228.01.1.1]|uniref:type II toxin-antitoxin system HipA family toxin n=1 Tax=Paraburkholderia phenoliruptrix TaxID=252970 RepID=UPI001091B080|nr:HipA domain-containing protein [Paraburkholderia phenoliruptrix]TGP42343.1 type II toxin-antitoxin system HipA family toxin [bacterium M00.F.Ca.ET.228.01.1.1]TGR99992.1 type II toxin-antitoxin system HipA family toxin [bacterium M00.F.Ca.ET.191.01.1.1]TGU04313.1 type II toxin-antitoxin system HipA family toxin [bacterium M00.F.Ca.ET.155.01.1.1]MBW0450182.1 type II toxin-antitoxin system HipA family toxin [Paraburkholderia phenoliruptrix]MBW9098562.1 type II toxin-antitoxin system HipA famil
MAATERRLYVFASLAGGDWAPAGQLLMTEDAAELQASSFAYGLRYINRPDAVEIDPVSLSLSDKDAVRAKRLFPSNGLALFGGIRDAAPDAWGRRVIEAKLKVKANTLPESTYLLHAGTQRIGALHVNDNRAWRPDDAGGAGVDSLHYLVDSADRIEEGLPVPANLEAIFVQGSGLGGARPKATVRDDAGVLWLAKFPSKTDRMAVTAIEEATLSLAAGCGIRVPPTQMVSLGKREVMLIRRFDRYWSNPEFVTSAGDDGLYLAPGKGTQERRVPFVSALTLIGCTEGESITKSYQDIAESIRKYVHVDMVRADSRELFKRMIFNIFVSNDDDHLRNHGFIWDARLPGWRLSPLYDVMPRPSSAYERTLHLGIGQQGRAATLDNALSSVGAFGLYGTDPLLAMSQVWTKVREWKIFFEEHGVAPKEIDNIAPAFRHIDDVSTAELRKKLP